MAMDFPGNTTDRYIDLGALNPAFSGAGSWCGWMHLRSSGGDENILITKTNTTSIFDPEWELSQAGSGPPESRAKLDTGSGATVTDGGFSLANLWHFHAMTYDGVTKRLYVDGALEASLAQTGNIVSSAQRVTMGAIDAGASIEREIEGLLDDVRIYDRGLSAAEIETMFALPGIDGIVHGLLHRWTMREAGFGVVASGAGSTKDVGPGQFNGTPINSPVGAESGLRF